MKRRCGHHYAGVVVETVVAFARMSLPAVDGMTPDGGIALERAGTFATLERLPAAGGACETGGGGGVDDGVYGGGARSGNCGATATGAARVGCCCCCTKAAVHCAVCSGATDAGIIAPTATEATGIGTDTPACWNALGAAGAAVGAACHCTPGTGWDARSTPTGIEGTGAPQARGGCPYGGRV